MSDQGFQAFKGESNELVMEERPKEAREATGQASTCEFPGGLPIAEL